MGVGGWSGRIRLSRPALWGLVRLYLPPAEFSCSSFPNAAITARPPSIIISLHLPVSNAAVHDQLFDNKMV